MAGDDGDRKFWERHAASYDRALRLLGRPIPRMLALVGESVSGRTSVLEVAAGTGLATRAIAPRVGHLVATDYAEAMVRALRARVSGSGLSNVTCERRDIYSLDYPPGRFDAVVACNVLHLVPDLPEALRALCGVLRPQGKLVAPTFCHDETRLSRLASRVLAAVGQPMHRRFTTASLRRALEETGLRVDRTETIPGLIPIGHVEAVLEAGG